MDSSGRAYPPYVTAVSGAASLGTVAMGGCAGMCGFAGEQQTSAPATITGVITSAPIAVAGTVAPQFAMQALDGSKAADGTQNLWALALPVFNASPVLAFSTTTGACAGVAPYCSTYTLPVPSQSPLWPVNGGTVQAAVTSIYIIYVAPGSISACTPSFSFSAFQRMERRC